MANRITGLNSGLDTESLVTSLVSKYQKKVDDLKGQQERHQWKADAWKEMNKNVVSFYNGKLNTMRWTESYAKKTTTSTNSSAVSIVTGNNAMNATQKAKVTSLATSAFATGAKVKTSSGGDAKGSTRLSDLGVSFDTVKTREWDEKIPVMTEKKIQDSAMVTTTAEDPDGMEFPEGSGEYVKKGEDGNPLTELLWEDDEKTVPKMVTALDENDQPIMEQAKDEEGNLLWEKDENGVEKTVHKSETYKASVLKINGQEFEFTENSTINDVMNAIKNSKINGQKYNANFDESNGRIYMAASTTGEAGTFKIEGDEGLRKALGLMTKEDYTGADADTMEFAKIEAGSDAKLELNGIEYKSNTGTFEINGLTITANEVTDQEFTITTKTDTSGIYNMVKDFFKDYNELIKNMDTKYNAADASKFNMLTEDEKYAMSDKQVEEWETKIKDGLLRRDQTLYTVSQAMKEVMMNSYDITMADGSVKKLQLSDFGINTPSYFEAEKNERAMFHIDGDEDDEKTKGNEDKLRAMIASDPDAVTNFFSSLAKDLNAKLFDLMKGTEYSSSFTLYEDKLMATQYSSYTSKITSATEQLNAKEDKYYKQFSKMETAMAKVNSTQTQLSSYFGG